MGWKNSGTHCELVHRVMKDFHEIISRSRFLVTGGAGFIGPNLVARLLELGAQQVRVLDNLSNGYYSNIEQFVALPNFEFIEGDIRDTETAGRRWKAWII